MSPILRPPKNQILLVLLAIYAISSLKTGAFPASLHLAATVALTLILEIAFLKFAKTKLFFPTSGVVTAVIIAFLTETGSIPLAAVVTAVAGKHLLKTKARHVFNPAVFGLSASSLFGTQVSWWGPASLDLPSPLLLIIAGLVALISLIRPRKLPTAVVFLGSQINAFPFSPPLLFFTLVMLPEPMTSPNPLYLQLLYALISSLIYLSNFSLSGRIDPLLLSLLGGNLACLLIPRIKTALVRQSPRVVK